MSQSGGRSYAFHSEMEHFYRSFLPDGEYIDIISDKLTCSYYSLLIWVWRLKI